jgi:hypothetical protein
MTSLHAFALRLAIVLAIGPISLLLSTSKQALIVSACALASVVIPSASVRSVPLNAHRDRKIN